MSVTGGWISRAGAGVLALMAAFMLVTAVWIGLVGWAATPLGDQWDHLAPEQLAGKLFAPHNEHRIILTRLTNWLDILLTRDTGAIATILVFAFNFGSWILLVILARRTWPAAGPTRLVAAGAAAMVVLASGFQFENFTSGFQNQFTGVFFFGVAASLALACAVGQPQRRRLAFIALSAACTLAAVACMASGLILADIMPVLALALGLRVTAGGFAVGAVLVWVLYLNGLPVRESSLLSHLVHDPVGVTADLLAYLGGALANTINLVRETPYKLLIARLFGVVAIAGGLALIAAAGTAVRRRSDRAPQLLAWAAIALFILGSGFITAVGRGDSGFEFAMLANRYGAGTGVLWAMLAYWLIVPRTSWRLLPAVGLSLAACGFLSVMQPVWFLGAQNFKFAKKDAEAALLNTVDAPNVYRIVHPDPTQAPRIAKLLRSGSLAMFAEPWSRLNGQALIASSQKTCQGAVEDLSPLLGAAGEPTWRMTIAGDAPGSARALAAVDESGTVRGLLIRGATGDEASKAFYRASASPRWSGYVKPAISGAEAGKLAIVAVNRSGRVVCSVSAVAEIDPLGRVAMAPLTNLGAPLPETAEISKEGIFAIGGQHESKPAPFSGRVWGSFSGNDANTGALVLRARLNGARKVGVPLITGPDPNGVEIDVLIDGRSVARLQNPKDFQDWSAFEIDPPAGSAMIEIHLRDKTSNWGGWLAVGEPRALCEGGCDTIEVSQCPTPENIARLKRDALGGMVDLARVEGGELLISGWAGDLTARQASLQVVAVIGGRIAVCAAPDQPREDVVKARGGSGLRLSGFKLRLPTNSVDGVVILSRQKDGGFAPLGALTEAAAAP
jgi:hypothetical protein